jgi:hypothetical protein
LAEEIGTLDRLKKAELIRLREEVTLKLAVSTGAEHLRLLQTLQATEFRSRPIAWCRTRSDGIAGDRDRNEAL